MPQEQKEEIRIWPVQKGAQHQDTSDRGCAWYAGQSTYHRGYQSRLQSGRASYRRNRADYLLADKGYDSNKIIEKAKEGGMTPVIPPRRTRINSRDYETYLYKLRHLVENAFLKMKYWRGIATRYTKRSDFFLAAVQIRCIALWAKIY